MRSDSTSALDVNCLSDKKRKTHACRPGAGGPDSVLMRPALMSGGASCNAAHPQQAQLGHPAVRQRPTGFKFGGLWLMEATGDCS